MTKNQAIKVLRIHQQWRRGGEGPQSDATALGIAIDTAIRLLSKPAKKKQVTCKSSVKPAKPKRFRWIRLKPAKPTAKCPMCEGIGETADDSTESGVRRCRHCAHTGRVSAEKALSLIEKYELLKE